MTVTSAKKEVPLQLLPHVLPLSAQTAVNFLMELPVPALAASLDKRLITRPSSIATMASVSK
jgi:hypothetical protein